MRLFSIFLMAFAFLCLPALAADAPPAPPSLAVTGPKPKAIEPPTDEQIEQAIDRGVALLLKRQNKDGSWGSADSSRPDEVTAPVPGAHHAFKAAVTALCISALIETGGDDPNPEVVKAIDRGETWLFDHLPSVRRATPEVFYNVWTHSYGIQALLRMLKRKPDDAERKAKILELIDQQIDLLGRYETVGGGWTYYDFSAHTQNRAIPVSASSRPRVLSP